MNKMKVLTIVVSVYNEEGALKPFWKETEKYLSSLSIAYEVIFVNDGSSDGSRNVLADIARDNQNVKVINFSRNFGHEAAMIAGIDHSEGDAVVCMDADLQHPPLKLGEMVQKFLEGYEIINMVRKENQGAGIFNKLASSLFYHVLNSLSVVKFEPNASDFFLISRRVADTIKDNFLERTRFLRGFIQIVGFKRTTIEYVSSQRIAGETKYSLAKLVIFSISAIVAFSNIPLRLGILFGTIVGFLSLTVGIYSIIIKLLGYVIPGYTTIVVLISFLLAIQFFILGIIGEYIGFIFNEIKRRPIYIVENEINFQKIK